MVKTIALQKLFIKIFLSFEHEKKYQDEVCMEECTNKHCGTTWFSVTQAILQAKL